MPKVVIFGISQIASLAYMYLTYDSPHDVVGFTVDRDYLTQDKIFDLPVISFDEVERRYPPDEFQMFLPISFKKMNRFRAERYSQAKAKGYTLISYISSKATTWPGFSHGDNCFIMENTVIQPFVTLGNDIVMWSGSVIAHHSILKDHIFIAPHVAISGACTVESYCFLGLNSTIRDETIVAEGTLVGAGAVILEDTRPWEVYKATAGQPLGMRSDQLRSISHKTGG